MSSWESEIEADLKWRETELATLKALAVVAKKGTPRQDALLRALLAMLYAHYEGFCKFCWDTYLHYIEVQGPLRGDCIETIARFSASRAFKRLRGNTSIDALWTFCQNDFAILLKEKVAFDVKLETQSNLWPNIARENFQTVGLPSTSLVRQDLKLKMLVGRRNDIAHGKKRTVADIDGYNDLEIAAFDVMYELAEAVVDHLNKELFLRALA